MNISKNHHHESGLVAVKSRQQIGWWQQWRKMIRSVRDYRFFIRQLIRINILTEFKRSFLGLTWLVLVPLLSVIIWILLNGAGIIDPGEMSIPYPAYVLLSTSIWGFFAEIYRSTSNIMTSSGRMLLMTPFPQEVLIVEKVLVHFIRFSIPFILNLIVLLYFGVRFSWIALWFPLTLIPLLLAGVGLGIIVAMLRIVAVDVSNLIDEGVRLLMFLTPIVYAPKLKLGWLSEIIELNPMTYLIGFSRNVLTDGSFYEPQIYALCVLGVLLFFALAVRIFLATGPRILERLINT